MVFYWMNIMAFYLSAAEKEIIKTIQEMFGVTELEATEQHIMSKRELAYVYAQRGQFELAEHLYKELDEWNEEIRDWFKEIRAKKEPKKIIVPELIRK